MWNYKLQPLSHITTNPKLLRLAAPCARLRLLNARSVGGFGFRISDRFGPFTPSRARSPINAKSLQSQGWECRKRPSGSGKLARSCNQVGARGVPTPMAGWPAGALVPSSPKVRLGLAHPPAHAHGSPRPPSPAWLLRFAQISRHTRSQQQHTLGRVLARPAGLN